MGSPVPRTSERMTAPARPTSLALGRVLKRRRQVAPYLFLLPSFLLLCVSVFLPIVGGFWLSLQKWEFIGPPPRYVGVANYLHLLHDSVFATSVRNTIYYTAGSVPIGIVTALALALLLNQRLLGRGLLRSAYFFPTVTSTVAVSLVWLYMFDAHLGVVNYALQLVGLPPQKWLNDPVMAMPAIILYGIWHGVGYNMMIFLAGLQAIPRDLYEAAMVDGANRRACLTKITLPLLRPVSLFVLITSVIGSFKVFDAVYVMTRGGPGYATIPMVLYIYLTAFQSFDLGYASAIGYVLFAVVLVITLVQLKGFGPEGSDVT